MDYLPISYKELLCDRKKNFRANGNIAEISRTSTYVTKTIADDFARSFSARDAALIPVGITKSNGNIPP
jgi:hypothetical protein